MKTHNKIVAGLVAGALALVLAGCTGGGSEGEAYAERQQKAAAYDTENSLELSNLQAKRDKEDDPSAIRYVYVMSYAQIIGYYVAKGKISSSSSQIGPETELIRAKYPNSESWSDFIPAESPKDDGSYGPGDPGIFFFTTEGAMIETSLDYIVSDVPMELDVPRLGG